MVTHAPDKEADRCGSAVGLKRSAHNCEPTVITYHAHLNLRLHYP